MEIGDISKVASRKRINTDVEKLRDKVSRETAKIIKLKVAQDTAYWDLKEKLQQVEGNHERLQQNMVEVQMQHETISGQYQEELRLRPDTLNKLSSSREISEVLQEYCERLKDTLSRCKADQLALCDAYQRSGQIVRDMKQKQLQADGKNTQVVSDLEEKVKITTEYKNQLVQFFTAFKEQAESELNELKTKVKTLLAQEQELVKTNSEQNKILDQCKFDLEKKEETIANLQKDLKQLISEYNAQRNEARNIIQQKEKELKELFDSEKELKEALVNQEQYTKSICDQNNELVEKVAAMEEDHEKAASLISEMKIKVEEATSLYDGLKRKATILIEEKERFVLEITNKDAMINKQNEEIQTLSKQLGHKNNEINNVTSELEKCREEMIAKLTVIEELKTAVANDLNESEELKQEYEKYKNTVECQIQELTNLLESKNQELDIKNKEINTKNEELDSKNKELELKNKELDTKNKELDAKEKELDSKANTITKLMSEMKTGTDIRSKLEAALQRLKQETERDKELERERQNKMASKIEHLEGSVKDKEESLSKQMSIIMEMRNEKERLQEKIQGMQNTIDNIQKELTGRPAPPRPADLDDNAVMLTPSKKGAGLLSPILQKENIAFAVPRAEPKLDNMLYNLFSDSSMEGDTIDSSEVNRRFHAISRGERVSPRPIASLKRPRRSGVPAAHGGLKMKPTSDQTSFSLSQVKEDLRNKERRFFKNKRTENKIDKQK